MTRRIGRPARVVAVAAAAALLVAACSRGGDDDATTTTTTTVATSSSTTAAPSSTEALAAPVLDQIGLEVEEIADMDAPIALAARPSTEDLYIAEKRGTVRLVKVTRNRTTDPPRYQLQSTPLLDISEDVIDESERGLLGMAFSTDGRRLYLDYTAEPDGRTVVVEYEMDGSTGIDEDSRRVLLEVEQPYANHNGGHLAVGRDGYLYISLGDGGDAGDPHGHGQDPTTLLGSILRIDPLGAAEGDDFAIPPGNPFADGARGAPEVWLYGVRNPWRFSFDRANGDLWVADVGQNEWEEITRLPSVEGFDAGRGANLGWDRMEGTHEFEGPNPRGAVLPLHEYSHEGGACSITGGFVYRGEAIGPLQGVYLFADYCRPGLQAIQLDGDTVIDERIWADLGIEGVQSFGEDTEGELFVLLASGPVLKVVPPGG